MRQIIKCGRVKRINLNITLNTLNDSTLVGRLTNEVYISQKHNFNRGFIYVKCSMPNKFL